MKEQTIFEHRRNNKNINLDYLLVYAHDTRLQKLVPIGKVKFDEKFTLADIIYSIAKESKDNKDEINKLNETILELNKKLQAHEELIEKIIKGKLEIGV